MVEHTFIIIYGSSTIIPILAYYFVTSLKFANDFGVFVNSKRVFFVMDRTIFIHFNTFIVDAKNCSAHETSSLWLADTQLLYQNLLKSLMRST